MSFWFRWAERPPTEADRDKNGFIMVYSERCLFQSGMGSIIPPDPAYWCRTHDIVKMIDERRNNDFNVAALAGMSPSSSYDQLAKHYAEANEGRARAEASYAVVVEEALSLGKRMGTARDLVSMLQGHATNLQTDAVPPAAVAKELTLLHAKLVEALTGSEEYIAKLRPPNPASANYTDNATLLQSEQPPP